MLWIYGLVISLLILGMFCFTVFAFIVTNHGAGKVVSGKGYKEYRLGDYSHWLQNHVVDGKNWGKFKSCLADTNLCMKLSGDARTPQEFYKKNLSPTQSGCCKPPTYCGYTYQNATFWVAPKSGPQAPDSDCLTWSNKQDTLCYDCKSCKAGILANMKDEWKKIFAINVCVFLFLTIVHCVGTCAYQGTKADRYKGYRGYH
ncbi:Tetraspanin-8 [Thalictrum thalictroides]|uniref:Tetraspanin-8 n=1 Tax=Thalictrum thalictroides TaxID=46969 RepID=A0A7J6WB94_THATH|nr:Tetraspanin-8 [Thalictrum thalictroides]